MALLETKKEKLAAIIIFFLVVLLIVASSISIKNYNALRETSKEPSDLQTLLDRLHNNWIYSIVVLCIALFVVVAEGGYVAYINKK